MKLPNRAERRKIDKQLGILAEKNSKGFKKRMEMLSLSIAEGKRIEKMNKEEYEFQKNEAHHTKIASIVNKENFK
jgi:hypothetical protein